MTFTWVTADLAAPARSGGQLRSARLIKALAARAPVDVVLLSASADAPAVEAMCGARSVTWIARPKEPVARRVRAARTRLPLQAATLLRPEAVRRVSEASARGSVIVADHLWTAPYLPSNGQGVLNLHNAEAARLEQGRHRGGAIRALEHQWELRATRRLERRGLSTAGATVVVSALDAERLGSPDALVVPNGTDLPEVTTSVPRDGHLVFVGSFDYPPNREGVLWWLAEVAPLLPPDMPPLTVVGRSADRALRDVIRDPRLRVVADVPDVTPYLEAASVVVQPLRRGGGTRLKLVEALGRARPVVATTLAAEGFPVRNHVHLRLADDAQSMALAVVSSYRDHLSAQQLAVAGREFALDYSWEVLGDRFADLLLSFAGEALRR